MRGWALDIQEYRLKRQLTQEELADLLGVTNITVSKWENGQAQPSEKHMNKLKSISINEQMEIVPFRPIQYLGSKLKLLTSIDTLVEQVTKGDRFCDLFSGSGVVSSYMANKYSVTACDIQGYSAILTSSLLHKSTLDHEGMAAFLDEVSDTFMLTDKNIISLIEYEDFLLDKALNGDIKLLVNFSTCASLYTTKVNSAQIDNKDAKLQSLISNVISLEGIEAFQTLYLYGGVYFSYRQALIIDLIRQSADKLKNEDDRSIVISSLLSACSEIVNTVGKQFAQPMKLTNAKGEIKKLQLSRTIQNKSFDVAEKTNKAFTNFLSAQQHITKANTHEVICRDVFDFLKDYDKEVDCFYADPPYTTDHYSRFYHVLETIALYDAPSLSFMNKKGVRVIMNGLYRIGRHQSEFCVPSSAMNAFDKLFAGCSKFKAPLIVSYSPFDADNNERSRLLSEEKIEQIARKYYSKVSFVHNESHKHRKLHSNKNNVDSIKHSEMFIVCEMK